MTYLKALISPLALFLWASAGWGVFNNDLHLVVVAVIGLLSVSACVGMLHSMKALQGVIAALSEKLDEKED